MQNMVLQACKLLHAGVLPDVPLYKTSIVKCQGLHKQLLLVQLPVTLHLATLQLPLGRQ